MQLIDLNLSHDNFFCPATGHHIVGPEHYDPSPAMLGMWHCEVLDQPEIQDTALQKAWDTYFGKISENEDFYWDIDLESFMESVERPNLACFKITTSGFACGPVHTTVWFVIDMDFDADEASVTTDSSSTD